MPALAAIGSAAGTAAGAIGSAAGAIGSGLGAAGSAIGSALGGGAGVSAAGAGAGAPLLAAGAPSVGALAPGITAGLSTASAPLLAAGGPGVGSVLGGAGLGAAPAAGGAGLLGAMPKAGAPGQGFLGGMSNAVMGSPTEGGFGSTLGQLAGQKLEGTILGGKGGPPPPMKPLQSGTDKFQGLLGGLMHPNAAKPQMQAMQALPARRIGQPQQQEAPQAPMPQPMAAPPQISSLSHGFDVFTPPDLRYLDFYTT